MLTKKNDSATLGNEDISTPNSRVLTKKKHQLQEHENMSEGLDERKTKILHAIIQTYLETEMPDELPLLRAYTDPSYPLVKCYNLEGAIREARQERVWMKSGAYLVIQPTEALTVIDVNSGKCLKKNSHFPEINREAAREAVRQIRLRNISGIIIIDFINMKSAEEKKELLAYLQLELKKDPNPGNVIGMTKLQLVEITRKKIRKTLEESLHG